VARHNDELTRLNAGLEQQVLERTAQLSSANAKLSKNYLGSIKAFSNLIELRRRLHRRPLAARRRAGAAHRGADESARVGRPGRVRRGPAARHRPCRAERCLARLPGSAHDARDKAQYEQHSTLGELALMALEDMQPVAMIVRSHHERHDGMVSRTG